MMPKPAAFVSIRNLSADWGGLYLTPNILARQAGIAKKEMTKRMQLSMRVLIKLMILLDNILVYVQM